MSEIKIHDHVLYNGTLKGTVEFIGTTHFSAGTWYGVKLGVPKGKNDGSVGGKPYFKCEKNHGLFVRVTQLTKVEDNEPKPEQKEKPPAKSGIRKPSVVKTRDRSDLNLSQIISEPEVPEAPEEPEEPLPEPEKVVDEASIEFLNYKVKDLEEKLQTLQIKRAEDKEKLKDTEKFKLMVHQLEENKKLMQEKSSEYQRSLDKTKQDYAKLSEEFEQFREETSSLSENIEMLTIDKEMAEEKVDSYRLQMEELNGKLEEVTLENEILKLEQKGGGTGVAVDDTQVNFIKTQNTKLRDAIIVLRDLSENQKAEIERLTKEVTKMESEFDKANKERNRLTTELKEAQESIIDLKEQVDSALGADEMVITLTEKNLSLEESVKTLEDAKEELEELCDMNNEINENNSSIISEMKQEMSTCQFNIQELNKALVSKNECILDYEDTIEKFRELVKDLQNQIKEYKVQLEITTSDMSKPNDVANSISSSSNTADLNLNNTAFKSKISKTNELAETIDHKLLELSVTQSTKHVDLLTKFLPENFFKTGNGNDAVMIVLLIDRMIYKVETLTNQVTENFLNKSPVPIPSPSTEMPPTSSADLVNIVYYQKLCYLLSNWYLILRHFKKTLASCAELTFNRLASLFSEMSPNEKSIDYLFDLLKKGNLDRRTSLEPLERSINYFQTFYQVHIANEQTFCNLKLTDTCKMMITGASAVSDCCNFINVKSAKFNWADESNPEIFEKLQPFSTTVTSVGRNIRKLTLSETILVLPKETSDKLDSSVGDLSRFVNLLCSYCIDIANTIEDDESEPVRLGSLYSHMKKYPELSHIQDNITLFNKFDKITETITSICDSIEQGQFDCHNLPDLKKIEKPVNLLALKFKNEISELENTCSKLSVKDEELKKAKVNFKLKCDELSEMSIRLCVAEKKLSTTVKEKDELIERLEQKYEQAKASLSRKERELDQTSEALQSDINQLEAQKDELKKQIKDTRKRNFFDNINLSSSKSSEYAEGQYAEVEALVETIKNLKQIIYTLQTRNMKLRQETLSNNITKMNKLIPIDNTNELVKDSEQITTLSHKLSSDIYQFMSSVKIVDLANCQPRDKLANKIQSDNLEHNFDKIKKMKDELIEKSQSQRIFSLEPKGNFNLIGRINFGSKSKRLEKSVTASSVTLSKVRSYFY